MTTTITELVAQLAVPEDRDAREERLAGPPRQWFAAAGDTMYPAVIELIRAGAKPTDRSQVVDGELVKDEDAEHYRRALARVRKLPPQAFEDALEPALALDTSRRADRAEVLETARLWFTNELQRAVAGPIGVHLVDNPQRWKL